ncbi:MAG: DUF4870 domain-containing protein [Gemmatimonadota bacterium]
MTDMEMPEPDAPVNASWGALDGGDAFVRRASGPEGGGADERSSVPGSAPTILKRAKRGGSGLPPNLAGALSYVAGPFTGAVFLIMDEEVPFVRFHALQAITLTVAWVSVWIVVSLFAFLVDSIPVVGHPLAVFLRLLVAGGSVGLWLYAMHEALRSREWEVPFVGLIVRRLEEADSAGTDS